MVVDFVDLGLSNGGVVCWDVSGDGVFVVVYIFECSVVGKNVVSLVVGRVVILDWVEDFLDRGGGGWVVIGDGNLVRVIIVDSRVGEGYDLSWFFFYGGSGIDELGIGVGLVGEVGVCRVERILDKSRVGVGDGGLEEYVSLGKSGKVIDGKDRFGEEYFDGWYWCGVGLVV